MTREALANISAQQLARDREEAAAKLEAVIDKALQPALREYERLTSALGERLRADLTQRAPAAHRATSCAGRARRVSRA